MIQICVHINKTVRTFSCQGYIMLRQGLTEIPRNEFSKMLYNDLEAEFAMVTVAAILYTSAKRKNQAHKQINQLFLFLENVYELFSSSVFTTIHQSPNVWPIKWVGFICKETLLSHMIYNYWTSALQAEFGNRLVNASMFIRLNLFWDFLIKFFLKGK